jgi:hypothetical protein
LVAASFNCHAPSSDHETDAVSSALRIEQLVGEKFPGARYVCAADSDLAASVALGFDKRRVQAILGPSMEVSRKLARLDLCGVAGVVATGAVVTNIRWKAIPLDCVSPTYGIMSLHDPLSIGRPFINYGKLVYHIQNLPRPQETSSAHFALSCAFHDMLEGRYRSAMESLATASGCVELSPHVHRFMQVCQASKVTISRSFSRKEILPFELWNSEAQMIADIGSSETVAERLTIDALSDDLLNVGCEQDPGETSPASDPPLICPMSHLEDSVGSGTI